MYPGSLLSCELLSGSPVNPLAHLVIAGKMKRRDGSSRRQVLDIDNPSTSWKSKFQAMTERRLNGSFQSSSLSKLVGSYASESDEEDGVKSKSLLDAKVDEFMKEVDSTKGNDDASIIPCAWQECYDEGTGYPYYWNMNTNEVTWEPPPELVAYQAAVAAKLAQTEAKVKAQVQQAQWAVEQAALGIIPEHPSPPKKISAPAPSLRKPSKFSSSGPPQSSNPRNQGRKRRPSSESEDEKIEMITSWVDEESEEEEETVNESQNRVSNNKKQNKDVSLKQSKPSSSSSSSAKKTEKIQKQTPMGPIGPPTTVVFGPKLPLPLSDTLPSKLKNRSRNGSTEEANEVESKVVIQKLRRLKTESDVIVGTRERVPIRKSLDRSRSGSPSDRLVVSKNKLVDSGSDSESGSEKSVLSRLQKHIEKLKDLGGSVPSDIKDLLTSATKSSSSSMTSADNIIALIEMEQPPDHKQDDKLLLSLKAAEQRVIRAVDRIEAERITNGSDKTKSQAQKPSSFALIAGYGDDSDQEEAVDSDTSTSAKDKTVKEKTLFPILGHEDNLKSDTSSKPVGKLPAVSDATVTLKANVDVPLKPSLVLDHGPGQKRKKRLDIGTIVPQPSVSLNSNTVPEVTDDPSKPKGGTDASTSGTASYTTAWSSTSSYSSDPTANDRRGFGFQVTPSDEEIATQQNKPKKGKISFIKAETINLTPEDSKNVRDGENEVDPLRKDTTSKSREDSDLHRSLSSLAQLVKAKLQFLNEGKEPVSPVQAMAIQIETLVSAWNAGALANSFLQRWLQSTGAELVQLERAAAPQGWAVQWDRYDIAVT